MNIPLINREYVATHANDITAKIEKICGAYWNNGKREVIPQNVQEEIIAAAREKMVSAIISNYNPDSPASPLTYGGYAAEVEVCKRTAIFFAEAKTFSSLYKTIEGGNEESNSLTFADSTPEPEYGRLPMRVKVDLDLLKEHLNALEWEVFYECRYIRFMEHADIARSLGWTESRYRWFWSKLKNKLLRLTDIAPKKIKVPLRVCQVQG